jgi:hypothetical protein
MLLFQSFFSSIQKLSTHFCCPWNKFKVLYIWPHTPFSSISPSGSSMQKLPSCPGVSLLFSAHKVPSPGTQAPPFHQYIRKLWSFCPSLSMSAHTRVLTLSYLWTHFHHSLLLAHVFHILVAILWWSYLYFPTRLSTGTSVMWLMQNVLYPETGVWTLSWLTGWRKCRVATFQIMVGSKHCSIGKSQWVLTPLHKSYTSRLDLPGTQWKSF